MSGPPGGIVPGLLGRMVLAVVVALLVFALGVFSLWLQS